MDQVVKVAGYSSSEGVHHQDHLFLHHLHLYDNVGWSHVCSAWTTHVWSFWPAKGIDTFRLLLVSFICTGAFLVLFLNVMSYVPLTQLLFQIMILFGETFTVAVRVWTCLSRAVGRNLSPWTLLVVAIEGVIYVWEAIVWLIFFPTDGANRWCHKNHQWTTQSLHARNDTYTIKRENLTESTGLVPAKYPLKVKLELLTTLECQS